MLRELQDQVLRPEVIDFALGEFGRQLKARLGKVSGDIAKMRARTVEIETELRRYADAVGSGGNIPAIIEAMRVRQAELDSITDRLLSTGADSVDGRLAELRRFVTKRGLDLRELLSKDVVLARTELLKHVQEIKMVPRHDKSDPHYEAWRLTGEGDESSPSTRLSNWVGCGGWI